ncbi:MAG: hypothetical protein DRQ40_05365 [Gammaproteobacteria bacterium]|nr:MAG: hypothetical protein DRQ40_05365 [Gammaproteobacteria bacterium]
MNRPADKWTINRERLREIWNPHTPDNMLVRHLALRAGVADPSTFEGHQKRIGKLARRRRRIVVADPTQEEYEEFLVECEAHGMFESDDG